MQPMKAKVIEFLKKNYLLLFIPVSISLIKLIGISTTITFVNDFLNLEEKEPKDFFMLILGSVASLFGILIAFVILSVEHSKERLVNNTQVNILNNPKLRNYIEFSISLLIGCFIAYFTINDFHNSTNLTLGYLLGFLFIVFLIRLYPFLTELINKSSRIGDNLIHAKAVDLNAFANISRYKNFMTEEISENNSLLELGAEIDNYILKNDVQSYQAIYIQIIENACNEIGDGTDRETTSIVIDAVLTLWKGNAKTAIRVSDSNFYDLFWEIIIKKIYLHFSKMKIDLLHSQEISSFLILSMPSFYKRLGDGISLDIATDSLEESLYLNLKQNFGFAEGESETEEFNGDFNGGLHWDYVVNIFRDLVRLQEIALLINDKIAFENINDRINTITTNILYKFDNLGKNQKSELIWKAQLLSFWISENSIEESLYPDSLKPFDHSDHFMEQIIKGQFLETKTIRLLVTSLGNTYKRLLIKKQLHTDYYYGTLHDFKSIGLSSVKRYNDTQLDKNVVDYFKCYFLELKTIMESKGIENFKKEYIDVKAHIDHFVRTIEFHKPDTDLLVEWVKLQERFPLVENETVTNSCWKSEKL